VKKIQNIYIYIYLKGKFFDLLTLKLIAPINYIYQYLIPVCSDSNPNLPKSDKLTAITLPAVVAVSLSDLGGLESEQTWTTR